MKLDWLEFMLKDQGDKRIEAGVPVLREFQHNIIENERTS